MVRAISGSDAEAAGAGEVLMDAPRLTARECLEIYRDGYRARLVECLADDYPVLAETLGDGAFEALCHEYVDLHPSRSPNLNAFGRHMPALCRNTRLGPVREHAGFFAELATLEWTLVLTVHAELAPPFDAARLSALAPPDWATARLVPSPALTVLRFAHPVNAFYQARRARRERPPVPRPAPTATAVYRKGRTLWRMDLTPAMARVLEALVGGAPIAGALGLLATDVSSPEELAEAERSVMIWFREWILSGFFSRVEVGA
jgi:hypothetical protein